MLKLLSQRAGFARIFGSSILSQVLLSGTNLLVGLMLVRGAAQEQYGYYVLINAAVPLLAQFVGAFVTPSLQTRVTVAEARERRDFVGGLVRDQRFFLLAAALLALAVTGLARVLGLLESRPAVIAALGSLAAVAWLYRDGRRSLLVAIRRSTDVLWGDSAFAVVLVAAVWVATLTASAAAVAALGIALAGALSGVVLTRALWRHEPWTKPGLHGVLWGAMRMGIWSAVGTTVHWAFSQGYTFIVASRLDVTAVGSIAATRLLLSPVGVFSIGISNMMYSTSTLWLKHHGPRGLLRRVLLFTLAMAVVALAYVAVMWLCRDWIFANVLKKQFPQRDLLLSLWVLVFLCTVIRDQVIFLLIAHGRWRQLALLTSLCAVLGLSVSFWAIPPYGVAGGLLGLLVGEIAHVLGVIVLTYRDMRTQSASRSELVEDGS